MAVAGVLQLRRLRFPVPSPWSAFTLATVAAVALPLATVAASALAPGSPAWGHLVETQLGRQALGSLGLAVGTGLLTLLIGVGTAWLVAVFDFPLRRPLAWGLVLPLAVPGYIIAFVYSEIFAHTGRVQALVRAWTGASSTAWMRELVMSPGGAVLLLSLVLHPYVFLVTRTAFERHGSGVLESARTLGRGRSLSLLGIAIPMARPAIAGGLTLVLMEVLSEYGAVRHFGLQTLTTGIFRAWTGIGDFSATMRLSGVLLLVVAGVILLERRLRGRARYHSGGHSSRPLERTRLMGWRSWAASAACLLPFLLGFGIPVIQLALWSFAEGPPGRGLDFAFLIARSFTLAVAAAALTVLAALIVVYALRLSPGRMLRVAGRLSVLGYAIPGVIVGLGLLFPLGWIDRTIDGWARVEFGRGTGLLISGTVAALLLAYGIRFLAVAMTPIDSGFERICGKLDEMSRSLGVPPLPTLIRVDLPLLRGVLAGALLLVFVDVLKELPLTLILRPFNFDTLATHAFQLASEERIREAGLPSLLIVLVGIIPVSLLHRLGTSGEGGSR